MALQFVITNAGRAAMVNPAGGTKAVQIVSVGVSPTAVAPDAAAVALPGEVKRITTIAGDAVAADILHLIVRDESDQTYSVRSFALYLADGTLFGIYGQAGVIVEKSAGAVFLLAVDLTLVNVPAANITFGSTNFLNPPATVDRAGVVELATDAEAAALADAMRALTPKAMATIFTAANILARLLTVDGAGSGLDADLLDGRHGAEFALLTGATFTGALAAATLESGAYLRALGSTPPATGRGLELLYTNTTGIVQAYNRGTNTLGDLFYGSAIALTAPVAINGTLNVSGAITRAGNKVWDQANDGAGSGLDADLLDGRDAREFALLTGATFTGALAASSLESGTYLRAMGSTPPAGGRGLELLYTNTTGIIQAYNRGTDTLGDLLFYGSAIAMTAPVAINGTLSVAGTILRGGNRVWDQGNDGAGSGLDADLLDGREAAEFALLAGATYTGKVRAPILESANYIRAEGTGIPQGGAGTELLYGNTTGYLQVYDRAANVFRDLVLYGSNIKLEPQGGTVGVSSPMNVNGALSRAGNKVMDVGNDGAGSGFDADLLDGRESTDFALLAGGTFTGATGHAGARVQGAAAFGSGVGLELLYSGGNGILQPYDRTNGAFKDLVLYGVNISINPVGGAVGVGGAMNVGGALTRGGNKVMDVGNDGAGSGFDADLLDGHEGSEYDRVVAYSSATNGYRVLADGTKECWGVVDVASGAAVDVQLPVAHTAWCVPIGSGAGPIGVRSVNGAPPTSFTVRNSSGEALTFRWHSRGV